MSFAITKQTAQELWAMTNNSCYVYGAQHMIIILNDETQTQEYVVVGHCCESWDLLSPEKGNPEQISTRLMGKANIGDFAVISSCGAYCSSMSAVNYNSYPRLPEILIEKDANIRIIRNIQSPEDVRSLEI